MAESKQSIVDRLADLGEEAIQRIGNAPGGDRVLAAMAGTRERMDDLQKRVRGLEGLDKRVAELEQRLEKLEGKAKSTSPPRKASAPTRKSSGSSSSTSS
jgi:polyhydroxyalkanoate synthesis regulator phasin